MILNQGQVNEIKQEKLKCMEHEICENCETENICPDIINLCETVENLYAEFDRCTFVYNKALKKVEVERDKLITLVAEYKECLIPKITACNGCEDCVREWVEGGRAEYE